jgi:hypothetical protein
MRKPASYDGEALARRRVADRAPSFDEDGHWKRYGGVGSAVTVLPQRAGGATAEVSGVGWNYGG